jgi:hypothetical protein
LEEKMKTLWASGVMALVMAMSLSASAADDEETTTTAKAKAKVDTASTETTEDESRPFVLGAYMGMGAALAIGNFNEGYLEDVFFDSKIPRFAGEGGVYFNYYLNDIFALEAGLGFAGKGFILKLDSNKVRQTFIDLEIPIGAKLNINNFQVALAINLAIAVSGKTKSKGEFENSTIEETTKWSGSDWNDTRRFNIGPKLNLGYAIPLGPVDLVPGLSWSMDLIDVAKPGDVSMRRMNIMLVVAGEFGFDGYID